MCLLRLLSLRLRVPRKPYKPFVPLTLDIPVTQSIQGQRYPEPLLCLLVQYTNDSEQARQLYEPFVPLIFNIPIVQRNEASPAIHLVYLQLLSQKHSR